MKEKELDIDDKLDSIVICKTMNLEKNLPLVILEMELTFEIKDVTVELMTDTFMASNPQDPQIKAFQYLFYDSVQDFSDDLDINQDELQNKMGSLVVKDTYSDLFSKNFKQNEYLSRVNTGIIFRIGNGEI